MRSQIKNKLYWATALGTYAFSIGNATAGNYNFGGNCPTQGAWTQMALQQTQSISAVIRKLKDDPNCKGIDTLATDLGEAAAALRVPNDRIQQTNRMESLPGEMEALRENIMVDGSPSTENSNLLMNRVLQAASIHGKLAAQDRLAATQILPSPGKGLSKLFERASGPVKVGLDAITRVMTALPQYDECLLGRPNHGLAFISSAVKVAAAFSASGEGVGTRLGTSLESLMMLMRDQRFTLALQKQNETEFWFSISCLMESTTKNYCDARNAQELIQYSRKQYQEVMKKNLEDRKGEGYDNPLEGYYLLTRELPRISTWLQNVQFGVDPKLASDAGFKNKIWEQVTDLTKTINSLKGYFSEQMLFMKELSDTKSKQNHLFTVLNRLVSAMSGDNGESGGASSAQFFTTTVNPKLLPFYLIGRESIPPECRPGTTGGFVVDWEQYVRTAGQGGDYVPEFNDPEKLAKVIESRMDTIIQGASQKSSAYFRQRLVIDMPNLVNQTLTGHYVTVRKSLENVNNYLVRFEQTLLQDKADLVLIPSVRETRMKIIRVLKSYDRLRGLGEKMITKESVTIDPNSMLKENEKLPSEVNAAAKEVIETVFNEFNILLQKDTFLTNRLTTFIEKDFAMRIRKGLNMTPYQHDLMVITQQHLVDKLTEVHGVNPTSSMMDLHQAQLINKRNLETLESVFKESMKRAILELKMRAEGKGPEGVDAYLKQKEAESLSVFRSNIFKVLPFDQAMGAWMTSFFYKPSNTNSDLYRKAQNGIKVQGGENAYGSVAQVQALFCAQTLAFEGRGEFKDLCRGTRLKSYYSPEQVTGNLDLEFDRYLPKAGSSNAAYRANPRMTDDAICAVHEFKTKNMVQWLKDQDAEMINDGLFDQRMQQRVR